HHHHRDGRGNAPGRGGAHRDRILHPRHGPPAGGGHQPARHALRAGDPGGHGHLRGGVQPDRRSHLRLHRSQSPCAVWRESEESLMQATSTARPFTTKKEFYAQFKKKSIAHELWLRFLKNKTAVMGLIIFCIIVAVAITAPWITNYDTVVIKMNIAERLQPPSMNHWFGTDELGRDILARIVYGARVSLVIGISAIFVSLMVGLVLG